MRAWLLVIVGVVAALVAVLVALDVVPLFGSGGERGEGAGDGGLLGDGADGRDPARLVGLPGREGPGTDETGEGGLRAADGSLLTWEARGSTPNGGSLTGRVVRGAGHVPVEGARVRLAKPDVLLAYLRADPKGRYDELEARTARDGRFAFRDITPARGYVVRASAGVKGEGTVSLPDLDLRGRPTRDLGDLVLDAGGTLFGRVLDAEAKPLGGVRVAATWQVLSPLGFVLTDPDTLPEIEREARTAEDGTFRIEDLEPGDKTLILNGGLRGCDVLKVGVAAGEETDLGDLALAGTQPLAGHVLWSDATPIAGARVFAGPEQLGGTLAVRTAESAADGSFRIEALPEGGWVLGVLVPGLPVHLVPDIESGRTDVEVRLPLPGSVAGTITREADGRPVVSFGIRLIPDAKDMTFRQRFLVTLIERTMGPQGFEEERGRFEFPRIAPGTYTVEAHADGHPPTPSESFEVVSGEVTKVDVALADGHGLEGHVLSMTGEGVGGARIFIGGGDPRVFIDNYEALEDDHEPVAVSGADGRFEIPPQSPGVYHLLVLHEDYVPEVLRDQDLERAAARPVEVRLKRAAAVAGSLVSDQGQPVEGETVAILYPDGVYFHTETDEDGEFIQQQLTPGPCIVVWFSMAKTPILVELMQANTDEQRREIYEKVRRDETPQELLPGRTSRVDLRMPRRTRLHGTLRVDGRTAGPQLGVWLGHPSGANGRWAQCDEQGRYEIFVVPGTYHLYAPDAEQSWKRTDIEVPDTPAYRHDVER